MDNRVIARLAREHGPRLIEDAVKALVAGSVIQKEVLVEQTPQKPQKPQKPSLGQRIASAALVRVATRSVPGAILVGGGLVAKALHDRHKARKALGRPVKQR